MHVILEDIELLELIVKFWLETLEILLEVIGDNEIFLKSHSLLKVTAPFLFEDVNTLASMGPNLQDCSSEII